MSYNEYFDMFYKVQQMPDCPYRAFMFDIKDSRHQEGYFKNYENHKACVDYIYSLLEKEEQIVGRPVLLKDKYNKHEIHGEILLNGNLRNPMRLGYMITYFVHNGSISSERMLELFIEALKKYNIDYSFHFATGVYQTNDYGEGGTLLFKGYMPQLLEKISKDNDLLVDCSGCVGDFEM